MSTPADENAEVQPAEPQESYAEAGVVETRGERLRRRARHFRLWTSAIVLVAAIVLLIAFIVSNTKHVRVNWVFGHSNAALVWVIVVAAILGWFAGVGTTLMLRSRARRRRAKA
jgi:uncharacterized integral membrane protein